MNGHPPTCGPSAISTGSQSLEIRGKAAVMDGGPGPGYSHTLTLQFCYSRWWHRQWVEEFFPSVSLGDPTLETLLQQFGLKV
jgi:hypothetical protein